ncbi:hypothetical protein ACFVFI_09095 [Streptomyces sp. NPDC057705]|uniref:hypothetical protein n=1 Tax=Streptomyces sp. NPDC057705 TaxID=3346222 RepID=UPI003690626E
MGVVISSVAAIWGFPLLARSTRAAEQNTETARTAEEREQEKREKEKREEAGFGGPAIMSVAGDPNLFFGHRFALPHRTTDVAELADATFGSKEYGDWFKKNDGLEVSVAVVRVTVFPIHTGTVVIQNMRLTGLKCEPTRYTGTAVIPPAFGDSGGEQLPTMVAFDLTEPLPRPWKNEGFVKGTEEETWSLTGNAFAKGIYLEGGKDFDARAFDLSFFTGTKDCEFGVDVNVTTSRGDEWYPIVFPGGGRRHKVAGVPERYETSVVSKAVEGPHVVEGPRPPRTPPVLRKGSFN